MAKNSRRLYYPGAQRLQRIPFPNTLDSDQTKENDIFKKYLVRCLYG